MHKERELIKRAYYYTQEIEEAARAGHVASVRYFLLQSDYSLWTKVMALRQATLKGHTKVVQCFNEFGYYWDNYDEEDHRAWLWRDD